ncbi:MAG TPA: methyltransferase domain-containing protein [Polyangia bacterium]|nr:methyltransferase domain-containing protein [Polyangia bacterium]
MDERSAIDLWYRRLPRYLYVEDLIEGCDVVEIGCGLGVGCDFLSEKGARSVRGIDRDEALLERARRRYGGGGIEFAKWDPGRGLPLPERSADLICVPEAVAWLEEAPFLDEVRRVLRADGRLLLAAASAERPGAVGGISYYELYELLQPHFASVRMLGQTPFLAYTLVEYADWGDEEPDLVLDTSLSEGNPEAVSHYVALAGPAEQVSPRGYSVVQIPFAPLEHRVLETAPAAPAETDPAETATAGETQQRIEELRGRLAGVEGQLQSEREQGARGRGELEQAAARAQKLLAGEIEELRDRLARAADERAALESERADLVRRLAETGPQTAFVSDLSELRARDDKIALLEGERQGLAWRVEELSGRLATNEKRWQAVVADVEERLRAREAALEEAAQAAERHRSERADVDAAAAEQVACVLELEQELLALRGRVEQTEARAAQAYARAEAAEAAERATRKRAAELEGELRRKVAPAPPPVPVTVDTGERDALRAEVEKLKEKLSLASSQSDVWMTKFRESERKAEEARADATRKIIDSKNAAAQQLQRALDESTRKLASARDETARAEKERREAVHKLGELTQKLESARIERDDARAHLGDALAAGERTEQRMSELAALIAEREAQIERIAGTAVSERRAAEDAAAREHEVRAAVAAAQAAREEAAREAAAARDQVTALQAELDRARAELERTAGEARAHERAAAEQAARLEQDAGTTRARVGELESALSAQRGEREREAAQVQAALEAAQEAEKRREDELRAAERALREAHKESATKQRALDKAAEDAHARKEELQKLRRELKERERRVESLSAGLADRDDKLARVTKELAAAGKQMARLEKDRPRATGPDRAAQEAEDALARLREEVKFRKADLEETEAALKQARAHSEALVLEVGRREAQVESVQAALGEVEGRAKREAELRQKAVEEARRAGERAQQGLGEAEAAREELSRARGLTQEAQERERRLGLENEERKERIKALKRELEHAEKRAARESERVKRLEQEIEAKVASGEAAATEVAGLRSQLAETVAQAAERAARVGELEAQLGEREREAARLGAQVESVTTERDGYERALREAEARARRNGEPARRVAEIGARLQAFEAGLHLEEQRLAGIEEALDQMEALATAVTDAAPLEARIRDLQARLDMREQELQEQLLELDRWKSAPPAPPPPAPAEAGQRDAEILALQSKIAGRRTRAHKLREEIEGYRGRLDRLTADEIRGLLDELAADVAEFEK